jgi:hypothetical protein
MFRQSGVEEEITVVPVTLQSFGEEVKIGEGRGLVQLTIGGVSKNRA